MIKYLKRQKWIWLDRIQLRKKIQNDSGVIKVIIGSGNTHYVNWTSTDFPVFNITKVWQWRFIFNGKKVDNFLAEHVFEHFTPKDVCKILNIIYQYLKSGGTLRIAVPDEFHPDPKYLNYVKPAGNGPGADDHKSFWNYQSLTSIGKKLGYTVELVEYWDEKGSFNHLILEKERGEIIRSKGKGFKSYIDDYSSLIVDFIK